MTKKERDNKITDQFKKAFDYYHPFFTELEDKEAIVLCKLKDSVSASTKSQVNDPRLLSIIMERAFRISAQLASGRVQALSKQDIGKSVLMDMVLQNYVIPNASSQFPILTKLRLVDFYSMVYGSFGVLVDYVVRDDYVGPDFWLIPIRDLIPQPGKTSIEDCDYVFVKTSVSKKWLKERLKDTTDTWNKKAIRKLLDQIEGEKSSINKNTERQSYAQQTYGSEFSEEGDSAQIDLVTKYERDKWTTIAADYPTVENLREMDNPQKNGRIPVVVKHAFPLLDRFHGLGEIEKGQTLQFAINSLINLYLDGVKFSIFQPTILDLANVVPSTIKMEPGAKWVVKNGKMDAIKAHTVSPQGTNTFQGTYQFLIAALMNQAGTSDTTVSSQTDPGLGKTPQALELISQRQNARDAYDRFMMEQFIEKVYDLFLDLIATKQEKPIKMNLFEKEIAQVSQSYPDALDLFESGKAGEMVVAPQDIKDTKYKFFINPGTTYKKDEAAENASIKEIMTIVAQLPSAPEQIIQTGMVKMGEKVIDFGELLQRYITTRGIQDSEKIVKDVAQVSAQGQMVPNPQLDQQIEALKQQIFGGGMPQQGMQMPMEELSGQLNTY